MKTKVAIIGPGNIGTDLLFKIRELSDSLEVAALVGIDPASDGLARAKKLGITTTSDGVEGLKALPQFEDIEVIFDATSAGAHKHNFAALEDSGKVMVDLTPASLGPYVVPSVNLADHVHANNVNMVTCAGQATVPIVAAISQVVQVHYAEIVASIASASAGPGTRANIDEFTETSAQALQSVGGAGRARTILILNPADPPLMMRDTIITVVDRLDAEQRDAVTQSVKDMVADVARYVPGYQLKQEIQFEDAGGELDILLPEDRRGREYTRIQVFLEVEGAAMYLPAFAGNLDIMTSAALRTAESLVAAKGNSDVKEEDTHEK